MKLEDCFQSSRLVDASGPDYDNYDLTGFNSFYIVVTCLHIYGVILRNAYHLFARWIHSALGSIMLLRPSVLFIGVISDFLCPKSRVW